jgi:type I restriction enzyme S subunit
VTRDGRGPYPEYKDSGIEWLGKIPANWGVSKLKFRSRRSAMYGANEPAASYSDCGARFIRTSDIDGSGRLREADAVYVDRGLVADYLLEDGDLLLSRSGTLGRSLVFDSRQHGECAYAGYLVRFSLDRHTLPRFAFYFTKSLAFYDWVSLSAIESTIGNVNAQKYANMPLPIPSWADQQAIADFLDRETSKIDALIGKKERLIELLQEKRTALITQAVTKGLDPNVPMKDSGIEWLGAVPAHWTVRRLKRLVSFRGGGTPSKSVSEYWQGDIPWVSPKDVKSEAHVIDTGAVLVVVRSGILRHSIPVAINRRRVALNQDMKALMPGPEVTAEYLKYLVVGNEGPLLVQWRKQGATVESIEHELLAGSLVPVPPLPEQKAISAVLDGEVEPVDTLIAEVEQATEILREYRTGLISGAVTGKIDVREAAS